MSARTRPQNRPEADDPLDGLEIRAARRADLRRLEWDGLHTPDRDMIEQTFERQQRGDALMLVAARADGFPVAQLWLDFADGPEDTALIWAVRTHPDLRGRGIGTRLMERAEREAAGRGCVHAELTVEPDNAGALRFYERLGYAHCGEALATYRCRSPEGEPWEWTSRQLKLSRRLGPEPSAPSASAGPSATSRTGDSRR